MADVRDILELERSTTPEITKETILGSAEKMKRKPTTATRGSRRPEGMHREVFALLCNDNKEVPPVFPTDTPQGYKQNKAKLGMRKVRPWKWMGFTNPARSDGAVFHHWRRVADEGKEYPFAKFNKQVPIPTYTDSEYAKHLQSDTWSRGETDHLFDLCQRFDLRFIVMQDRWDRERFPVRSVEDLKERYYNICSILARARAPPGHEPKVYVFDADHERRRKEQLKRLFERTQEQVDEEQMLVTELRKIELRKKEREKKQQDLQKLITAAGSQAEHRRQDRKDWSSPSVHHSTRPRTDSLTFEETAGIKFPDIKSGSIGTRSQKMKLPASVGQKKIKVIEQMLMDMGLDIMPMPTEEICTNFNELRSDLVLLYELRAALSTCEFELQTLRHQFEALYPGKTLVVPSSISQPSAALGGPPRSSQDTDYRVRKRTYSEVIDVVGSPGTSFAS